MEGVLKPVFEFAVTYASYWCLQPCQEFNADTVIHKMMTGRRWPRAGYLKNLQNAEEILSSCNDVVLRPLATFLSAGSWCEDSVAECIRGVLQVCKPETASLLHSFIMNSYDIKEKWRINAERASAEGTWTHLLCECVLNGGDVRGECLEMEAFQAWLGMPPWLLAYRTEWCPRSAWQAPLTLLLRTSTAG